MMDTLFIDLDGTLVNSRAAFNNLFDDLAGKFLNDKNSGGNLSKSFKENCALKFHTLPHSDYLERIGWGWDNMFYSDFTGGDSKLLDLKNAAVVYRYSIIKTVLGGFGITDNILIEPMINYIRENWINYYRPFPDTHAFLEECKNSKKYILTNGFADIQIKKIHHCGFYEKFDGIFISGNYGIGKPDTKYFQIVLNSTGAEIKSTVMIGNSLFSDIAGAKNMGMKTIWIKEKVIPESEKNITPDAAVTNLAEVPELLKNL